jgi:hypothetical protein
LPYSRLALEWGQPLLVRVLIVSIPAPIDSEGSKVSLPPSEQTHWLPGVELTMSDSYFERVTLDDDEITGSA